MEATCDLAGTQLRLVVGLGNPGPKYHLTRHNIGFLVAEELARRHGASWSMEKKWNVEMAKAGPFLLVKPLTFMNASGTAVRGCMDFFHIAPTETLVVMDDLSLPLGRIRIRRSGSDGGHNGLGSVLQHLGTKAVPRLRLGIGSPVHNTVDYVLARFSAEELEIVASMVLQAAGAVESISDKGLDAAMNFFNNPPQQEPKDTTT